jgi:hypothetical protein
MLMFISTELGKLLESINISGFDVFTAVVMKSIIFWDITPCTPLSVNRRFGEHIASIFRVEEISSARNQQASR